MCDVATIPGLAELWARTRGDERVVVAVIDGPIDLGHAAFAGARVQRAAGGWPEEGFGGPLARHGTAVASVIFGQPGGPVPGIAPGCSGISSPGFSDRRTRQSQLEMARAIEAAVESSAHIINISGGQLTDSGEAYDQLDRAVRLCHERNVLIVAAVGNDGCFCDRVPAALPSVLAVGALGDDGEPAASSNWGRTYQDHGLLAPGENVLAALPRGETARLSGTSFATPIVAGVAALLLSLQLRRGEKPDPLAVREALLASADACELDDPQACRRFLTGKLNIERAVSAVMSNPTEVADTIVTSCGYEGTPCACGRHAAGDVEDSSEPMRAAEEPLVAIGAPAPSSQARAVVASETPAAAPSPPAGMPSPPGIGQPSGMGPSEGNSLVFALGTMGYDFGTEARRDAFKQAMSVHSDIVAQPYDQAQMRRYLLQYDPAAVTTLIWTLNLELTPIYAIEPVGPYAASIYTILINLLRAEFEGTDTYVERVSIPGRKTGRTVRLFSGQVVPVVELELTRGIYGWTTIGLVNEARKAIEQGIKDKADAQKNLGAAKKAADDADAAAKKAPTDEKLRETANRLRLEYERARRVAEQPDPANLGGVEAALTAFLTRVYYDLRNLGSTSRDRALNFAATNIFNTAAIMTMLKEDEALDMIAVEKSPFCRMDSDCWDVKMRFFDQVNSRRARQVYRYTVDVSEVIPVLLGEPASWPEPG